jgi:hypothetical protein
MQAIAIMPAIVDTVDTLECVASEQSARRNKKSGSDAPYNGLSSPLFLVSKPTNSSTSLQSIPTLIDRTQYQFPFTNICCAVRFNSGKAGDWMRCSPLNSLTSYSSSMSWQTEKVGCFGLPINRLSPNPR